MPLCFPKYDQIPIKIEDIRSKQKPINSAPIFIATVNEYKIAVVTPAHSKKKSLFGKNFVIFFTIFINLKIKIF
tara:strand:- start:322 stop:543 length:222 start_codon:yes stop_codon:yes gene_type:complete